MSTTAEALRRNGIELPEPGTWEVDPSHSTIGFVARHLMVTKVRGRFADVSGTITVDQEPERSSVRASAATASVDTGSEMRDNHLRSGDFFDVETFPAITFESTGLSLTGDDEFKLTGNLTIKDVTRPVTFDVTYLGVTPDPWGGTRIGFSATADVDREDWGLTWNQTLESGGVLVSKKVTLELDIQARKA